MVILYHCHLSQRMDPTGYPHWPRELIDIFGQMYFLFAEKNNSEHTDS